MNAKTQNAKRKGLICSFVLLFSCSWFCGSLVLHFAIDCRDSNGSDQDCGIYHEKIAVGAGDGHVVLFAQQ